MRSLRGGGESGTNARPADLCLEPSQRKHAGQRSPIIEQELIQMSRLTPIAVVLVAALALAGCTTTSPDVIQRSDAQQMSQVQDAVVLSVRPVTVEGSQSGVGAAAGGVVGGVAGSSVGGYRESIAVGVLGAVVGGVVGNAVERQATREDAVEILVQLKNGERRAIVQAKAEQTFAPGDPVVLVTTGGRTRVTKAVPATAPAQPAPAPVYTPGGRSQPSS
jgi:outer membrane lipoprotein SlyB